MESRLTPTGTNDSQELPEFFPTIIVDPKFGEYFSDFTVNLHKLTATLLESGLSPEQVSETTIAFMTSPRDKYGQGTEGKYEPKLRRVNMFPIARIDRSIQDFEQPSSPEARKWEHKHAGEHLGRGLSRVLRHELEHRIVHAEGGMPEEIRHWRRAYLKSLGIWLTSLAAIPGITVAKELYSPSGSVAELAITPIATLAVSATTSYIAPMRIGEKASKTSPEEARAYNTETSDAWGLVTGRLRFQDRPLET